MNNFIIFADSGCDLPPGLLKKMNIELLCLNFSFDGEEKVFSNYDLPYSDFYKQMRNGKTVSTSSVNSADYEAAFEKYLKIGTDILYLGFSSGLSSTYEHALIARNTLKEKYPERKIICEDSLCASGGYGLLLQLAAEKRDEGQSIDEISEYIRENRLNICHWYTVESLVYLKRGGRISSSAAVIGNILDVKPIMHMDDCGKLVGVSKVRGRKASLKALCDKYGELFLSEANPVFISHCDCGDDAARLKKMLEDSYLADVRLICDVGPVIGAHCGPGTVSIFFLGKER